MHSKNSVLIRTINHLYAMALEFCVGKLSNTRLYPSCRVSAEEVLASPHSAVKVVSCHPHRLALMHRLDALRNNKLFISLKLILIRICDLWIDVWSHIKGEQSASLSLRVFTRLVLCIRSERSNFANHWI